MHIVIMAWLFVIGTMALTSTRVGGGGAFFAFAGGAPLAFYAWIKRRRLTARRRTAASAAESPSVRQQRVDGGDDADTGRDQQ